MTVLSLALQIALVPLAVLAAVVAWTHYDWVRRNPARLPYPPGPKGLPLVGNIFDMPRETPWLTFREWSRQYGK